MTYNLLFNTEFNSNQSWHFINCRYDGHQLISNKKIFGIEQEVVLPNITKIYARFNFNILDSNITKVTIGIQNENKLFINTKTPKKNTKQFISLIEDSKSEKIKIHIIFESSDSINKVTVRNPLLCDLIRLHKSTWLKFILDKTLKYREGLNYKNILNYSEIDSNKFNLEKAKVGSIISTLENKKLKIDAKLIKGKKYLIKLDYLNINDLGNVFISYGIFKSKNITNTQSCVIIKADDNYDLILNIEPNDILPYQINLKHIMILEAEGLGIDKNDIPYLPFI